MTILSLQSEDSIHHKGTRQQPVSKNGSEWWNHTDTHRQRLEDALSLSMLAEPSSRNSSRSSLGLLQKLHSSQEIVILELRAVLEFVAGACAFSVCHHQDFSNAEMLAHLAICC